MIWALIVLTIVMIASASVLMIQTRDSEETMDLEENITHYYVALAGLEYGYAALMADYDSGIFAAYYVNNSLGTLNSDYDIVVGGENVGNANVSIYLRNIQGEDWIVVESTGKALNYEGDETLFMRMNAVDNSYIVKDGKTLPNP